MYDRLTLSFSFRVYELKLHMSVFIYFLFLHVFVSLLKYIFLMSLNQIINSDQILRKNQLF